MEIHKRRLALSRSVSRLPVDLTRPGSFPMQQVQQEDGSERQTLIVTRVDHKSKKGVERSIAFSVLRSPHSIAREREKLESVIGWAEGMPCGPWSSLQDCEDAWNVWANLKGFCHVVGDGAKDGTRTR